MNGSKKEKSRIEQCLAKLGMEHRWLKYPVLAGLFALIIIRKISSACGRGIEKVKKAVLSWIMSVAVRFFNRKRTGSYLIRHNFARRIAMVLVAIIIFECVDVSAWAYTSGSPESSIVIATVAELPSDVLNQKLYTDATEEDIVFPETIRVGIIDKTAPMEKVEETETVSESEDTESVEESADEETAATEEESLTESGEPETDADADEDDLAEPDLGEAASDDSVSDIASAKSGFSFLKRLSGVFAADEADVVETEVAVRWILNLDESTKASFDEKESGDRFIYNAIVSDEYSMGTDAHLPRITVDVVGYSFDETVTVDGVKVRVCADEGVFDGASSLSVRKVTSREESNIREAVDEVAPKIEEVTVSDERGNERREFTDEGVNVAESYALDIKVLDKDGNELEPDTSAGKVNVLFTLDEVKNNNIEANVYHVTGEGSNLEAVPMDIDKVEADTLSIETDGFSYYVVEFTYGKLQYVLEGDSKVALTDILEAVEIEIDGEITEVISSNDELFLPVNEGGTWYIAAVAPFSSKELLTVTMAGIEYEIVVMDDVATAKWDTTMSPEALVNSLLGEGIEATVIRVEGTVYGFSDGLAALGMDAGIILDTSGTGGDAGLDGDLEGLVDKSVTKYGGDTSVVEFSMKAKGELLNFNYAFASGEFHYDTKFNDCFGLFVKINGGAFENIALLPDSKGEITTKPVTLTTLRNGFGSSAVSPAPPENREYDYYYGKKPTLPMRGNAVEGVSKVFNAQKKVSVDDIVTVKMVIADVYDDSVDSYVMIEAGSLSFDAPGTKPDYEGEKITDFEPGELYEITIIKEDGTPGEKYLFTPGEAGEIPMYGTDKDGKEYDFLGKKIRIVRKGDGVSIEDSEPQELDIGGRPEAEDPDIPADEDRPTDVDSSDITVTSDTVKVHDRGHEHPQQYSVDGGKTWIKPDADGYVTFTGLTPDTEYTVKARIAPTDSAPGSFPTDGISVKTFDVLEYTASGYKSVYDAEVHSITVVTTHPDSAVVTYSMTDDGAYTDANPTFKDVGKYIVYYTVSGENCMPVKSSATVEITKRPVIVDSASDEKIYDGEALTNHEVKAEGVDGKPGFISGEEPGVKVTGTITDVGTAANTYELVFAEGVKRSNYDITENYGTLEVKSRALEFTSPSDTKVYDGTPLINHDIAVTGDIPGDEISVNVTGTITNVGTVTNMYELIFAEGAKKSNYSITENHGTLEVTKREINLVWVDTELVYNGAKQCPKAFVEHTVPGDECLVTVTGGKVNAGEYSGADAARATALSNPNYKLPALVTSDFKITPKQLTWDNTRVNVELDVSDIELTVIDNDIDAYNSSHPGASPKLKAILEKDIDYTVDITDRTGYRDIVITGTGNYYGELNKTISVKVPEVEQSIITYVDIDESVNEQFMPLISSITEEQGKGVLLSDKSTLSDSNKEKIATGDPSINYKASVYVEMKELRDSEIPAIDEEKIASSSLFTDKKLGAFWDLSLYLAYKIYDSMDTVLEKGVDNIKESDIPHMITITVPEGLRPTADVIRTYFVGRVHEGVEEILCESEETTITFEADKFSTYFLMYKDVPVPKPAPPDEGPKGEEPYVAEPEVVVTKPVILAAPAPDSPKTGDAGHRLFAGLLMLIGIGSVLYSFKKKDKEAADELS